MNRDFIFKLGVASVAALAAKAIPYCPAQPPAGQQMARMIKISKELFEDKMALKWAYEEALKGVPEGYECRKIDVGLSGPAYEGDPGDFVMDRLSVVFRFYPA